MIRILHVLFALVLLLNVAHLVVCQDSNTAGVGSKNVVITDPLVRMLIAKGVLTENEGRSISESGNATEQRDRLADLLREKGIISSAEYDSVRTGAPIADRVALSTKSNPETADTVKREQPPTPQADQATARDARRSGARGSRSDLFSGNVQYKLNSFVTFGYEQGLYRTRATDRFGALPLFRGIPSFTSHNVRSELAVIFSF